MLVTLEVLMSASSVLSPAVALLYLTFKAGNDMSGRNS